MARGRHRLAAWVASPALLTVAGALLGIAVVAAPLGMVARSRSEPSTEVLTRAQVRRLEASAVASLRQLAGRTPVRTTTHDVRPGSAHPLAGTESVVAEAAAAGHRWQIMLGDGPPVSPASPCRGPSAPPALDCVFEASRAGRPALLTRTTVRPAPPGGPRGQHVLATSALADVGRTTWMVREVDAFWPDGSLSVVEEAVRARRGASTIGTLVTPTATLGRVAAAPALRWSTARRPTDR